MERVHASCTKSLPPPHRSVNFGVSIEYGAYAMVRWNAVCIPTCKLQYQISRTIPRHFQPSECVDRIKSNGMEKATRGGVSIPMTKTMRSWRHIVAQMKKLLPDRAFMMWKRHRKYYIANDNGEIPLHIHLASLHGFCVVVPMRAAHPLKLIDDDGKRKKNITSIECMKNMR